MAQPRGDHRERVIRQLGVGGMGQVFLVQHPRLPRQDPLKLLNAGVSRIDDFKARFQREADLLAQLSHQNIVTVHDRGESRAGIRSVTCGSECANFRAFDPRVKADHPVQVVAEHRLSQTDLARKRAGIGLQLDAVEFDGPALLSPIAVHRVVDADKSATQLGMVGTGRIGVSA